jgi:hypothetical protein
MFLFRAVAVPPTGRIYYGSIVMQYERAASSSSDLILMNDPMEGEPPHSFVQVLTPSEATPLLEQQLEEEEHAYRAACSQQDENYSEKQVNWWGKSIEATRAMIYLCDAYLKAEQLQNDLNALAQT